MKQGTISVLVGCHSPIHSYYVIRAWRSLYGKYPKPWETGCIFLHDLGHWGKDYLDDYEMKRLHWKEGAAIAQYLFGRKGFELTAGHCSTSDIPKSPMYLADKQSWLMMPYAVHWLYCQFEPMLLCGEPAHIHIPKFQEWVRQNLEREEPVETHNALFELSTLSSREGRKGP